ncbi:MAG TPA: PVC-type heme-binding CxxCH protein, partial [Verrucomicrobiae bacterium]|nr:PVC-type heme-binding CxxCH protein [Verrucomicrobiae bacterium]
MVGLAAGLVAGRAASVPSPIEVHPALEVHLFAQEPQVVDPVAMCFDAAGRMYVVEMRDYPHGLPPDNQPGGTVRLLEDTNGDGRADRSVVFAERLSYPTSIAPYRDGVIVIAPPEIVFLKDTDGDGRSDVREVLYHGFRRGVTDGNMSGLRWGLDNWLHGVNGGPGGEVVSTRKRGDALRLGNLDFRLKPDLGEIETTYTTGGGFGLVFDDWGRSFTPHNVNHMQMRIMPGRVLARNAGLPPVAGTHSISDHGEMARIHAISEAQTRPNHPEQAGYFSAAGAVGFIG